MGDGELEIARVKQGLINEMQLLGPKPNTLDGAFMRAFLGRGLSDTVMIWQH
jgi:hypothetical protein